MRKGVLAGACALWLSATPAGSEDRFAARVSTLAQLAAAYREQLERKAAAEEEAQRRTAVLLDGERQRIVRARQEARRDRLAVELAEALEDSGDAAGLQRMLTAVSAWGAEELAALRQVHEAQALEARRSLARSAPLRVELRKLETLEELLAAGGKEPQSDWTQRIRKAMDRIEWGRRMIESLERRGHRYLLPR